MYLACGTWPDIAFVVGLLSRHKADPRKSHLSVAERVVRYLKETMQLGLMYGRTSEERSPTSPPPYGSIEYANSNFAGHPEDRKSVIEKCFFLNRAVVLWRSKKQEIMSTSTTEAEYIALGHAAREAVWICRLDMPIHQRNDARSRRFINETMPEVVLEITLNGDNEMSIALTKNANSQHPTKYIDV